jgi:stage IV sporulation protein B
MNFSEAISGIGNTINRIFGFSKDNDRKISDFASDEKVYLGGFPIGLKLYADGVIIVGTEPVDTKNGVVDTALRSGLRIGDIIKKVNGKDVSRNGQISDFMEKSNGNSVIFTIDRNGKIFDVSFQGAFSESEKKYKAGIWVRDSSAGIGTVAFYRDNGRFASLGHAVCDIDTKMTLPISKGDCTDVRLTGYVKGVSGSAGELQGYLTNNTIGEIFTNGDKGVYGTFSSGEFESSQSFCIAAATEVVEGEAEIYTTLDDSGVQKYSIKIEKIDKYNKENKHLVIKVTDKNLIKKTGGIIQGMSGSPIVQNGKIVGAVTHVFLNDSTSGYGIFAQTMFESTQW